MSEHPQISAEKREARARDARHMIEVLREVAEAHPSLLAAPLQLLAENLYHLAMLRDVGVMNSQNVTLIFSRVARQLAGLVQSATDGIDKPIALEILDDEIMAMYAEMPYVGSFEDHMVTAVPIIIGDYLGMHLVLIVDSQLVLSVRSVAPGSPPEIQLLLLVIEEGRNKGDVVGRDAAEWLEQGDLDAEPPERLAGVPDLIRRFLAATDSRGGIDPDMLD